MYLWDDTKVDTEANLLMKKPLATHPERSRRVIAGKMPIPSLSENGKKKAILAFLKI